MCCFYKNAIIKLSRFDQKKISLVFEKQFK